MRNRKIASLVMIGALSLGFAAIATPAHAGAARPATFGSGH